MANNFFMGGSAPGPSGGFSSAAPALPAPTTWQQGEQEDAIKNWNAQAPQVYGAESSAFTGQENAIGNTNSALARLQMMTPQQLGSYTPSDLAGYNPSSYLTGAGGAAGALAKSYADGSGGSRTIASGSGNPASDFSAAQKAANDLGNFDPSAAGMTFAKGAEDAFNQNLTTQLAALQRGAAGTGRLQTGFYTGDQGTVATNLGKDFNSQIAQAALTFSGQRLSALQGAAGAQTTLGSDIASARQAATNESDAMTQAQRALAVNAGLTEEGMTTQEQEQAASLGLSRANDLSNLGLSRAQMMDQFGLTTSNDALQAALAQEQMARQGYQSAASTAAGFTSATRDYAMQDKATQDQIDFENALLKYLAGMGGQPAGPGGITLPATTRAGGQGNSAQANDPYAYLRSQAASLGVPFVGPGPG